MILEGERDRQTEEANERMTLAWHIEALARQKKLPRLKDILNHEPKRPQTPQQIEAITRSWLAGRRRK